MKTIPLCEPIIGDVEKEWILKCLDSGYVSSVGSMVGEFEDKFAEYVGARYAIATVNGTAAIHVSLHALGVDSDASVFIPDLTFIASMTPVLYCGATPVLIDIDRKSWCMQPEMLEKACADLVAKGNKPNVVMPVHLYGCSCDMSRISDVARRYDLKVLEDATEALGTRLNDKHVGTIGDIGCFSFNGNKMITTGNGGMVVTDSKDIADKIRYLVNQSRDSGDAYVHSELGFNYRMSNLAAALGLAQMERIDAMVEKKREIAKRYDDAFKGLANVQLPPESQDVNNSYWLYSLVLNNGTPRDSLQVDLNNSGVAARKFFEPLHSQPYVDAGVWTELFDEPVNNDESNSSYISRRGLNLPCSVSLSDADQERVISCVMKCLSSE